MFKLSKSQKRVLASVAKSKPEPSSYVEKRQRFAEYATGASSARCCKPQTLPIG